MDSGYGRGPAHYNFIHPHGMTFQYTQDETTQQTLYQQPAQMTFPGIYQDHQGYQMSPYCIDNIDPRLRGYPSFTHDAAPRGGQGYSLAGQPHPRYCPTVSIAIEPVDGFEAGSSAIKSAAQSPKDRMMDHGFPLDPMLRGEVSGSQAEPGLRFPGHGRAHPGMTDGHESHGQGFGVPQSFHLGSVANL